MKNKIVIPILLVLTMSLFSVPIGFSYDRTVGVNAGDIIEWQQISSYQSGMNATMNMNIISATTTTITANLTNNGYGSYSQIITIDVTQIASETNPPFIIGRNLAVGDLVVNLSGVVSYATQILTKSYWATNQEVVYASFIVPDGGSAEMYWDRNTGILCEYNLFGSGKIVITRYNDIIITPPDTTFRFDTAMASGNWLAYKIKIGRAGASIYNAVANLTGMTVTPEQVAMIEQQIKDVEKESLKLEVVNKTSDTITFNIFASNGTITSNQTITCTLIMDPNTMMMTISSYLGGMTNIYGPIAPIPFLCNYTFLQTNMNMLSLLLSQYLNGTAKVFTGESRFYAGAYRQTYGFRITIPHVISTLKGMLPNSIPFSLAPFAVIDPNNIPEMDVEFTADWDVQYNVLLGVHLGIHLSSTSWYSYAGVDLYTDSTNLWQPSSSDGLSNAFQVYVLGLGGILTTWFIDGAIFGDATSLMYLIGTIVLVLMVCILVVYGIQHRRKKI